MSELRERLLRAREDRDVAAISELIPFNRYLGIAFSLDPVEGLLATMGYRPHLVGNQAVPALHGGTVASLLETTALFLCMAAIDTEAVPRIISTTVDYLRPAALEDTFAAGRVVKSGRRVSVVQTEAWQRDRQRLIATGRAHVLLPSS